MFVDIIQVDCDDEGEFECPGWSFAGVRANDRGCLHQQIVGKKIRFVTKYNVHNSYILIIWSQGDSRPNRIVNFVQYLKTFELQTF